MSCHGNQFLYERRCVACRTISLPSFNGLCYKLTEIALFIYSCGIGLSEGRHHSSPLHNFTHFSNLNIFGTNPSIFKR